MSKKLTKFVSATTIVTSDFANSMFGGLFGSTEGDALDTDDPKVAGHVHDGQHSDGHSQKIDLVSHVTSQLRNSNLADDAVTKRNVASFTDPSLAIPVSEIVGSDTFYYIDINTIPGGAFEVNPPGVSVEVSPPDVTSNIPGDLINDDLVFGSDSLDDDGNSDHDNRMLFDKSEGTFRAGNVSEDQWDAPNRGTGSVAFGVNNIASGLLSYAHGFLNISSGQLSAIVSGQSVTNAGISSGVLSGRDHNIDSLTVDAGIGSGRFNRLVDANFSFISAGNNNEISSQFSFIGSGAANNVTSSLSSIVSGSNNTVDSNESIIGSGFSNSISANSSDAGIFSGSSNSILNDSDLSIIGSGAINTVDNSKSSGIFTGQSNTVINSDKSAIIAGEFNSVDLTSTINTARTHNVITGGESNLIKDNGFDSLAAHNVIVGGKDNSIERDASYDISKNAIVGGDTNVIKGTRSFIGGGSFNLMDQGDQEIEKSVIAGGEGNQILAGSEKSFSASNSSILGGQSNIIKDSSYATILGGQFNIIDTSNILTILPLSHSTIIGGVSNVIDIFGLLATAKGAAGRGYLFNQHSIGGGGWDASPAPAGQAQTSDMVISREITALNTPTILRLSGDIPGPPTFGLIVPLNTCILAKASWIVRRDKGSGSGFAVAGERWAIFKREFLASTLVAQGDALAPTGDVGTLPITPLWSDGPLGLVTFTLEATGADGTNIPARGVARIEWTQVYQETP